jgi:hypothetical protein
MFNCEWFYELDGQRYPVLKFDGKTKLGQNLDGQKWTFSKKINVKLIFRKHV